ncbi:MAG: TonB-dependent receptor [candidate division Zixibacteria bacterium]|nr:TonB-dependent receptor [candidate division Zixibacteria bacterium]
MTKRNVTYERDRFFQKVKFLSRLTKIIPLLISLLLVFFSATLVQAGVVGKISGLVEDSRTGKPIVGATIRINGTSLVTQTDVDGEFFVINLPVGKYDISVTSVGYKSLVHKNVLVLIDLTTPVNFEINQSTLQLQEEVVVTAENPVIQKDLTASKVIFTSDHLKYLPNIITVKNVLTNYPGVIVDRDNDLHLRGGRAGQISYYFDGFSVQDPFISQSGIKIMPSSLEQLSLTSGGYTAEYGEALSGVVSAITREGGESYHGGFKMYEGLTHPYNVRSGEWAGLNRVGNRSTSINLSGPIPGLGSTRNTFFVAGEYLHEPSYLPHNGSVSYTGTTKLSLQPSQRFKIKANFTFHDESGEEYIHRDVNGVSYDFNLDGLPSFKKNSFLAGISGLYSVSERLIITNSFNYFMTNYKSAPGALFDLYWDQWPGYTEGTIDDDNYLGNRDFADVLQATGFTVGNDFKPTFRWRESIYSAYKLNVIGQVNKTNQIKAGFEWRKYKIDWDYKLFFNDNPYGEKYNSSPSYISGFVQDKMEYKEFIINLGIRVDYRDADISYNVNPGGLTPVYKQADSKTRWAPRLGISFPISSRSKMHFNYGLFYQEPSFRYLYTNLEGDVSTGYPLLGNPDLNPEQTTSYELGLDHLIDRNIRLNVVAYFKDINDLVTTRSSFQVATLPVTHFDNDDYGSVKGIGLTIEKFPGSGYLSGSISYSYQIATGIGSTALEPYYTYITSVTDTLAPVSEYPLDFDQRHTVIALMSFRAPRNWDAKFLGMRMPGAWNLSVVGSYGSGLPYTSTDNKGSRLGERNEARLPSNYRVDMRFNKEISFGAFNSRSMSFFVEVDNLFNKKNILGVYTNTGRPDNDGNAIGAGLALDANDISFYDNLYDHDPQNFSPPRTIRTGIEFSF